ncbi:MAG: hypothetical protein WED10_08595, partial [Brumimicrobium sp.]
MKQLFTYLIIFAAGIFVGFLVLYLNPKERIKKEVKTVYRDRKVDTKTVYDTVTVTESLHIETSKSDSLTFDNTNESEVIADTDSIVTNGNNEETSEQEVVEDDIIAERMLSKRNLTLKVVESDSIDDSELLNINTDRYSSNMIVEFWESPLELTGYELTRNKLKLFGFNPN